MSRRVTKWLTGAIAGLGATVPMTVFMVAAHGVLPRRDQEELPPAKITGRVLRQAGVLGFGEPAETTVTLASHLAYGAVAGMAYSAMVQNDRPPSLSRGIAFGVGLWAGSYLGWLPAAGVHRPATDEPLGRNLLMIGAHVVWGASLAAMLLAIDEIVTPGSTGEDSMNDSDRYTIIRKVRDDDSETVATGLSRDEAQRWLAEKARETKRRLRRDLVIPAETPQEEAWQAVKAE